MTIVGYFGGVAATGAVYEIVLYQNETIYRVQPYSSAPGAVRKPQSVLYEGDSEIAARTFLLRQADKKRNGRDRQYLYGLPGTPGHGVVQDSFANRVDTAGNMPVHAQIWQTGRPIEHLPAHIQAELGGQVLFQNVIVSERAAPPSVPDGMDAVRPQLCADVEPAELERYLTGPWSGTRKYEGQRGGALVTETEVIAFNRKGEPLPCPHHIAEQLRKLPAGTRVDGELVALSADGTEALYAGLEGARFAVATLVVFDVLYYGGVDFRILPEHERWGHLEHLMGIIGAEQHAVRLVERAADEDAKRAMLEVAIARGWEGLVFRDQHAPYIGGRPGAYRRYKLRRQTYDAFIVGYEPGRGQLAGLVGAVEVAVYNEQGEIVRLGKVGGWARADRERLQQYWDADMAAGGSVTPRVIRFTTEGFTAQGKVIRPGAAEIRPEGDKQAHECRLEQIRSQADDDA